MMRMQSSCVLRCCAVGDRRNWRNSVLFTAISIVTVALASPEAIAHQGNDDCADAIPITDGCTSFDNLNATTDGPDHGQDSLCDSFFDSSVQSDIWYCYIAPTTGEVLVSLCNSDYDTKIAVYDGCSCPADINDLIACNDDSCGLQSEATFFATAGNSYLMRVGGFDGLQGQGEICITSAPPINDCNGNGIDDSIDLTPVVNVKPFEADNIDLDIEDCDGVADEFITHSIFVNAECGSIDDLDIMLDIDHTWVGDLVITLRHENTGTEITLLSRIGFSEVNPFCAGHEGFGSPANDMAIVLDDEANLSIEGAAGSPKGFFKPHPGNTGLPGLLSTFDGEDKCGVWRLTVHDAAQGDIGEVNGWGLIFNNEESAYSDDVNENDIPDECENVDPKLSLHTQPGSDCVQPGGTDTIFVELRLSQLSDVGIGISGFQAFIGFDPLDLEFITGIYTDSPFGFPLSPIEENAPGEISLSAGINLFTEQLPTHQDAVVAILQFAPLRESCATKIFFRTDGQINTITDETGDKIEDVDLCDSNPITIDGTSPRVLECCPPMTIVVDANCSAYAPQLGKCVVINDNCIGPVSITQSPPPGTLIGLGDTAVMLEISDCAGNSTFCQTIVTVVDHTPPSIACPANQTLVANNDCEAFVPDLCTFAVAFSSDNCDTTLSCVQSPIAGTAIGQGVNEVLVTVTDNAGNSDSCTVEIEVVDEAAPQIAICGLPVTLVAGHIDNSGPGSAGSNSGPSPDSDCRAEIPDFSLDIVAVDNCTPYSQLKIWQSPDAGTHVGLGLHEVTIFVEDLEGHVDSCVTTVYVIDQTPPELSCPGTWEVAVNGQCQGTLPDLTQFVDAEDNCSSVTLSQSKPAGSFILGLTTINIIITATDEAGNSSECTILVSTVDATAPIILDCPQPVATVIGADCQATVPNFASAMKAVDNCTAAASLIITQDPIAGTIIDHHTDVELTVTDASGNMSKCTTEVRLIDITDPVITCPESIIAECEDDGGANFNLPDFIITDNCEADFIGCALTTHDLDEGNILSSSHHFPIGRTILICAAQDDAGNTDICTFSITVVDTTPPEVDCYDGDPIEVNTDSNCMGIAPDLTNEIHVDDQCDENPSITQIPPAGSLLGGPGNYSISFIVSDSAGNEAPVCKIPVLVIDDDAPIFTVCASNLKVNADSNCQTLMPGMLNGVVALDNCSSVTLTQDPPQSAILEAGEHKVLITATDEAGNSSTCEAILLVSDLEAPVIEICAVNQSDEADEDCLAKVPHFTDDIVVHDNCDDDHVDLTQWPEHNTELGLGTHVIIITATDEAGNTDTCEALFTVVDATAPKLACGDDVEVEVSDVLCAASVAIEKASVWDNCDDDVNLQSLRSDSQPLDAVFQLGETIITWTATDDAGNVSTCEQTVLVEDNLAPALDCPSDITVFAAPGSCEALVDVGNPFVKDNCDQNVKITAQRNNGNDPLDAPFEAGITTITWTATDDSGNESQCEQLVIVHEANLLLLDIELSPVVTSGSLTRCITFEVFDCEKGDSEEIEMEILFTDGIAKNVSVPLPCGNTWDCLTAQDQLHTLRRTDTSFGLSSNNGDHYVGNFMGDNALIGGDLNNDHVIDVSDFAILTTQFLQSLGGTSCGSSGPHSDITGDGLVFIEDFSFVAANFRTFSDPNCCGQLAGFVSTPAPRAKTKLSVKSLQDHGQANWAVADLTGDGWIDEADMIAFAAGMRPGDEMYDAVYTGKSGGSWFDARNWADRVLPQADARILLPVMVIINAEGATAGSITIANTGALVIENGSLTAESVNIVDGAEMRLNDALVLVDQITIAEGGVLSLTNHAAVLSVHELTLQRNAMLNLVAGILEITGRYQQADENLILSGGGILNLRDGATARIIGDVTITDLAELIVEGLETSLTVGRTLTIDGEAILTILDQAVITADELIRTEAARVELDETATMNILAEDQPDK